jgi:FixJ family two-component response regulator
MSEMTGLEFYRKLWAAPPEPAERLAFITGVSGRKMYSAIKSTGMPLLHKPFSRREILEFFSRLHNQNSLWEDSSKEHFKWV